MDELNMDCQDIIKFYPKKWGKAAGRKEKLVKGVWMWNTEKTSKHNQLTIKECEALANYLTERGYV